MGRRSTKENKSIYQLSRERCGLSREAAGEGMVFVSPERVEKIESGKSAPHPDEVLAMERCYADPELSGYYCVNECPIGMKYSPRASLRDLPGSAVELLASISALHEERDRLVAIAADGRVDDAERAAFDAMTEKLGRLESAARGMRMWIEHALSTGKLEAAE